MPPHAGFLFGVKRGTPATTKSAGARALSIHTVLDILARKADRNISTLSTLDDADRRAECANAVIFIFVRNQYRLARACTRLLYCGVEALGHPFTVTDPGRNSRDQPHSLDRFRTSEDSTSLASTSSRKISRRKKQLWLLARARKTRTQKRTCSARYMCLWISADSIVHRWDRNLGWMEVAAMFSADSECVRVHAPWWRLVSCSLLRRRRRVEGTRSIERNECPARLTSVDS